MPASKMPIDFRNVKEQAAFNTRRKPEGDYLMIVKKVEDHTSKNGNKGWVYTLVPVEDQRASYPYYVNNDPDQAWKIRNLFVAAGTPVPKKRVNVDPNRIVGQTVGASLEDDEYEGRPKSVIGQVFPGDDLELAEDTLENKRKSVTKRRTRSADDDDDVEELDDNEYEDEEEPAPPRRKKRTAQTRTTKRRARPVIDEDEDEDDVDELDLEEL